MFLITNIFCDLIMLNAFKTHTKSQAQHLKQLYKPTQKALTLCGNAFYYCYVNYL